MKYRCIMVKSVTYAQKAKKILAANGIKVYIVPVLAFLKKLGKEADDDGEEE